MPPLWVRDSAMRTQSVPETKRYKADVVIAGAGPVGLSAVFQFGMLGLRCALVDPRGEVGGQCAALYPEKPIYDIPGFERVSGRELVMRLYSQAAPFSPLVLLGRQVVDPGEGLVRLDDGSAIEANALVVAGGAGMIRPRRPDVPEIAKFEEGAIVYAIDDVVRFRGRRIVVAGGGDSAADWALHLGEVAAHVTILHRRDKFACAPETERRLRDAAAVGRLEILTPYRLEAVDGTAQRLMHVDAISLDGARRRIAADHLVACFGLDSDLGPIGAWNIVGDKELVPVDPATMATRRAGIYAIGDIAVYPGKRKLILCGFSEAAICASAVFGRVRPTTPPPQGHSTTRGVVAIPSIEQGASAA